MKSSILKLSSIVFPLVLFSSILLKGQDTIAFFNFDDGSESSWITGASGLNWGTDNRCSWEINTPKGGLGYKDIIRQRGYVGNPDPMGDHSNNNEINNVAGQGLSPSSRRQGVSAHYNNSSEWIQSPAINCSDFYNTVLSFWRWANFEPDYDFAFVEISEDGINWEKLNHPVSVEDTEWTFVELDISAYADGKSQVFIRWRSESDGSVFYSGWNIDDVIVSGLFTNNDMDSKITQGNVTIPRKISSLSDTYDERVSIGEFVVTDAGSGDNLPTIIDTLVIVAGSNNTIKNWKKAIDDVYLFNPGFTSSNSEIKGIIKQDSIIFIDRISIEDGQKENFELRLFLKKDLSGVNDKERFEFVVNYGDQVISPAGSFINDGFLRTGAKNLKLRVKATELRFLVEPKPLLTTNRSLLPIIKVAATDENGNIDVNFSENVTLSNSGNLTMRNYQVNADNGIASFVSFQFEETGGPVNLSATSTVTGITSTVNITISDNLDNLIFFDDFDDSGITGWTSGAITGQSSWGAGEPNGGRGYSNYNRYRGYVGNSDPIQDKSSNTINKVIGQGLSASSRVEGVSSYYNNSDEWIMTPPINCINHYSVQLSFWRWANFEPNYDSAFVEISTDGTVWNKLSHTLSPEDNQWVFVSYDISTIADRKDSVYVRWRSSSDDAIHYAGWNIDNVELSGIFSPLSNWTGTISSNWHEPGNWENNTVPDEITKVVIRSGTPYSPQVITPGAICNDISIQPEAILEITENGSLEVYGDVLIKSTQENYGAIIDRGQVTVHGKGRMSRTISKKDWHYVSSPFIGTNTHMFGDNAYTYDEPLASENWARGWVKAENQTMEPGKGYNVYKKNDAVIEMEGQFNTGTFSIDVTNTNGSEVSEHEGWNLVGNPYPSAIDWDAPRGWTKTNINDAIYIWDKKQQNYVTYVGGVGVNGGTSHIPPMQGFFVKVNSAGTGLLQMTNEVRVSETRARLKSLRKSVKQGIKLKISSSLYFDETVICFNDNTNNLPYQMLNADKRFTSNSSVPQIYTVSEKEQPLSVHSISLADDYLQIPVFIKLGTSDEFKISIDELAPEHIKTIYLEDLETGTLIDLKTNPHYTFSSTDTLNSSRFTLHINMPLTIDFGVTHVSNYDGNDGSIDLTVLGGEAPIKSIEWSNGFDSEDIENLTAGQYSVIITDWKENTYMETVLVQQPTNNELITGIGTVEQTKDEIKIFSRSKRINVIPANENTIVELIRLFDLSGRTVFFSNEERVGQFIINLDYVQSGVYVVHVKSGDTIVTQKVYLN